MSATSPATLIRPFSKAIFVSPERISGTADEVFALRKDLLIDGLNSFFFGGRHFIFFEPFHRNCVLLDKKTNHPVLMINPEPEALGFKTRDDAIIAVTSLVRHWGYADLDVAYMGAPCSLKEITENEREAKIDLNIRAAITERFGESAAKKTIRTRVVGAPYSRVTLESSKIYRALDLPLTKGWKAVALPLTLPDGEKTSFSLHVGLEGLDTDLTAHFFDGQRFRNFPPFRMFTLGENVRNMRHQLFVHVQIDELGYKTLEDAHYAIRKLATDMGYLALAQKMLIITAGDYSKADILKAEQHASASNHPAHRLQLN